MTKKQPPFTSLRIIGEKAQKFFLRATDGAKARSPRGSLPPAEEYPELTVHLSIGSVVKAAFAILAIVLGTVLFYYVLDTVILLALAIFIAVVIDPGVQLLERLRIPRGIGILVHYLIALALIVFLVSSLIPIIAKQLQEIALSTNAKINTFLAHPEISLPLLTQEVNAKLTAFVQATLQNQSVFQFTDALQHMGQSLSSATEGSIQFAVTLAGSLLSFVANLILVLVLAFFIQIEKESLTEWLRGFLPHRYRKYLEQKSEVIHFKLGQWMRGQLMLCVSVGVLVFIALKILNMEYAVTLAMFAGFTEFIPIIGPMVAAIPAFLIAVTSNGFLWALVVAGIFYSIQWCENNLLVPIIMKRAVGLSPIAVTLAMLVGLSFPQIIHPILGIMLAIPTTTVLALFLEDYREMRMQRSRE